MRGKDEYAREGCEKKDGRDRGREIRHANLRALCMCRVACAEVWCGTKYVFLLPCISLLFSFSCSRPPLLSLCVSLPPSLSLSSSCPCSHSRRYQAAIVPSVVKMFASNDRALRIQLLQTLESYVANLGDALIEKTLFTQVRELVLYLYLQVSNTRSLATYLHCHVKINRHLAET